MDALMKVQTKQGLEQVLLVTRTRNTQTDDIDKTLDKKLDAMNSRLKKVEEAGGSGAPGITGAYINDDGELVLVTP